ncbi:TonB-dependent receptor plug domain-containing protein [Chitinimonas taiwanensis]|uniref:Iron complex outermembrane recepter protein n=1 Tax=Chitinimonas taiwanensis DSM 18899 TaxID=1121279 RepID=A0A1K2HI44_9NEIS|nr:TonB-dependent receptor [Chitinimonas taiwanensis]SFZ76430.1 iron complex outermembrane recepter protein [Chitinimonas taiwanensis DSM 18899]
MQLKKISQALLVLGVAGIANHTFAAEEGAQKAEKIEVTGSRIKRISSETPSPLTIISRKEIEQSGKASVAEVLRSISANNANSYNETFTNSFAPGASGISLRGLGQKATLVLLNGRRVANYGFAQNLSDAFFDLNSIPASAIQRIEVLRDGASAVYGSDAIAGVVNVILRKDFAGLETTASAGTSTEGGLNEYRMSATGGIGNIDEDKFNVLLSVDYLKRDSLRASERDFTKDQDFRKYPGGLFGWSAGGGTFRVSATARQAFANCPNGTVKMDASNFNNPYTGSVLTGDVCAFNTADMLELMPGTERVNAFARGTADFGVVQGYGEVLLSHTDTDQTFTPAAISNSGTGTRYNPETGGLTLDNHKLPVGHPNNPFATTARFAYAFLDVGPRSSKIISDSYRVLGGLKGEFSGWDWDFAAGTSESKAKNTQYNRINGEELVKAITNATYDFYNPSNSKAVVDKLRLNIVRESTSTVKFADFKVSGELFDLPAGTVGMAAGLDWRSEEMDDRPDAALAGGLVLGQGATRTQGKRDVTAGFVEFVAPLTKQLEMTVAGRQDSYSDFGSAFAPKLGLKWTPAKQVMLRGSYSEGFRAPTLAENAQSNSTFFVSVIDSNHPVAGEKGKTFSVAGVIASNPNLEAEKSKSYTLGMVFEPSNNFNATVDYYKIRQNKLVSSDDTQFVVDNSNLPQYKDAVVRDAGTGNILYVVTSYRNLLFVETKGVDLTATWRSNSTKFGRFTADFDGNYLLSYRKPPADGQPADEYVGRSLSDGTYPRFKATVGFGWEKGDLTSKFKVNHTDGYRQEQAAGQTEVTSNTTLDWYGSYVVNKQFSASLSVQNVFDRTPPFDAAYASRYGIGTNFTLYDLRGRYVRATGNYKF